MNILYITHVWNEIDYLPLKARWCEENELPMFVIDNMSDDGTWEWCQKANLVGTYRYDSNGSFHLDRLQDEVKKTLAKLKPDWVVYGGADLFFVTKDKLRTEIIKADAAGYNMIELTPVVTMLYTGETYREFDPVETFHFANTQNIKLGTIFKYETAAAFKGDTIFLQKPNPVLVEGAVFNFGMTKGKDRRDQTLARRQKAWKEGLKANFGHHLADAAKHDWIWHKKAGKDVRNLPFAPYYQILHDQLHAKDQVIHMTYVGGMPEAVNVSAPYKLVIPETKPEKELWLSFLENSHDFPLTREGYEKALITPLIFKAGMLVFFKKEIVGCCAACEIIGGTATIMYVYVDPKHRHQGIGKAMMITVIRKVLELGYKHIALSTAKKRIAAVELYKKLGFEDENSRTS